MENVDAQGINEKKTKSQGILERDGYIMTIFRMVQKGRKFESKRAAFQFSIFMADPDEVKKVKSDGWGSTSDVIRMAARQC